MDIPNAALRKFFIEAFSDDELEDFCFDYLPAASQVFSPQMSVGSKARALIEFADSPVRARTNPSSSNSVSEPAAQLYCCRACQRSSSHQPLRA